MNDARVKDQAFWEKVKEAVTAGQARGESVTSIVKQFNVSAGGWTYAKGRFGWGKRYGKSKKTSKFVEYKPANAANPVMLVEYNGIKITVHDVESLKSVIETLKKI